MTAYLSALGMVLVAEMGDKTQLIAMAFAARFRPSQVLWGVFLGSLSNHAIAVLVGTYLGDVIPVRMIGVAAAALFLLFGLMGLRPEEPEEEEQKQMRFGPVLTVALTFFLGEMADKTQLATLGLAAKYQAPLWVLAGAVSGMMVANSPGVFVGDWLFRRVSKRLIKLLSSAVFLIFGLVTLYQSLDSTPAATLVLLGALAGVASTAWYLLRKEKATEGDSQKSA